MSIYFLFQERFPVSSTVQLVEGFWLKSTTYFHCLSYVYNILTMNSRFCSNTFCIRNILYVNKCVKFVNLLVLNEIKSSETQHFFCMKGRFLKILVTLCYFAFLVWLLTIRNELKCFSVLCLVWVKSPIDPVQYCISSGLENLFSGQKRMGHRVFFSE